MKSSDLNILQGRAGRVLPGMLLIFSFSLTACMHIPSGNILSINQVQDVLYVTAKSDEKHGGYVKAFDANNYMLKRKITINTADNPNITAVFQDAEGPVIIVRDSRSKASLYRLEQVEQDQPISRLGVVSQHAALFSGADQDFFYAISSADKKERGVKASGIRYDKTLKRQMMFHFNENPGLVVIAISEDNDSFWYVCLEPDVVPAVSSISGLKGRLVIAKRAKDKKKDYTQFEYSAEALHTVYSSADEENIWIFASNEMKKDKVSYTEFKIVKFSKTDQKFLAEVFPMSVIPFPHQRLTRKSGFLWALGTGSRIIRISKADNTYVSIPLPKHLRTYGTTRQAPVLSSDDDSLLIGVYDVKDRVYRGGEKLPSPFILKFSKENMQYEQIPVKPTTWEAAKTSLENVLTGVYSACCLNPIRKYESH